MLILHHHNITIVKKIAQQLNMEFITCGHFYLINNQQNITTLDDIRTQYRVDINFMPEFDFAQTAILMSDMDSTMINIECIDEMAKAYGVGDEVMAITEAAMEGRLDFSASLRTRLALLKGMSIDKLEEIYQQVLAFNPGAKILVNFLNQKNILSVLVSGGFDFFAQKVCTTLGMSQYLANVLAVDNKQLTGKVKGNIIDGTSKAELLSKLCQEHKINLKNSIVMGDGSNDLAMMEIAGLSVAHHAKPQVRTYADIVIDYGGLDVLLDFFVAQKSSVFNSKTRKI